MNDLLQTYLNEIENSSVHEAMQYSLLAGGKRIRPKLLYHVLEGYNVSKEIGDPFACAIEMIHTYSLIHDDLPAMDNDDFRRGNLTCHKQFDEATAILAGDGLLTYAFGLCTQSNEDAPKVLQCIDILSKMAGASGMIYGQVLDIEAEGKDDLSFEDVKKIHKYKTGCLLTAPLLIGCILADRNEDYDRWEKIGYQLGLAFQIQDDVMDVTLSPEEFGKSTSDIENNKLSSVSLLGIEKASEMMNQLYDECIEMIKEIQFFNSQAIIQEIEQIRGRKL